MKHWDVAGRWGTLNFSNSLTLRLCTKPRSAPTTAPVKIYYMRKILLLQRKEQFTVHADTGSTERQEIRIIVLQVHLFTTSATTVPWKPRSSWGRGNNRNQGTHGRTECYKITQQIFWGWGGGQCGDLKPLYVALLGRS